MKPYTLRLEISGPIALWARPDTMPNPVSYVAPTFSAVKGIFEAILRWKSVNVRPTRCEICAPVQFHRYAFNYGGPLRKSGQIKDGASLQIFAQALINVCYRPQRGADLQSAVSQICNLRRFGRCKMAGSFHTLPNAIRRYSRLKICATHVHAFQRRLERGRWFYTPCLGWKEFVPDYVGPFCPEPKLNRG